MSTFGSRPARAVKGPRPEGSWAAAVKRARESWDELTAGPTVEVLIERSAGVKVTEARYSDAAAAPILATALGLWADTAAALDE